MFLKDYDFPRYVSPDDIRSAVELLRSSDLLASGSVDFRVRRVTIHHESEAGLETACDFFSESLRAVSEGTLAAPIEIPEEEDAEGPVLVLICEDEETEETEEEEDEPAEEEPEEDEEEDL